LVYEEIALLVGVEETANWEALTVQPAGMLRRLVALDQRHNDCHDATESLHLIDSLLDRTTGGDHIIHDGYSPTGRKQP
jgi:hypothetical protein